LDLALQQRIERREARAGLKQLAARGRVFRSGGLLNEAAYVLALRKNLSEKINRHEFGFRIQHWTA